MIKRLTAIIILFAAVISYAGCSRTATVRMSARQEKTITKNTSANIVEVRLASGITGAILKNWDVVSFDSLGGKYDPESDIIRGVDVHGAPVELNLTDIRDVQVNNDSRIRFDKDMGWLDVTSQQIHGATTGGKPISIPLRDVLDYKIRTGDPLKTILAVNAFSAVVIGIMVVSLEN
jgi:hypothetical protein